MEKVLSEQSTGTKNIEFNFENVVDSFMIKKSPRNCSNSSLFFMVHYTRTDLHTWPA